MEPQTGLQAPMEEKKMMLKINSDRLNRRLAELAEIGARPDGGVCRLAFSDEDLAGRQYVERALKAAGLDVRMDAVGNLFGILKGTTSHPAIMIGSHTDTVATGGWFDGALGVLAALECVERLVEEGVAPGRTVVVASFVNEEGVRYMPDMMGSLFHSNQISLEDVLSSVDEHGISVGAEIERLHYAGEGSLSDLEVGYFIELHIEQGPVLEDEGVEIGIVTGVQGLSWTEVTVEGSSNHAGTTPMNRRKDAGEAAGRMMSQLRELPTKMDDLRLTIGSVRYHPNLVNVIPDRVQFTVDLRHPDPAKLQKAEEQVYAILERAAPCTARHKSLARVEPCTFSETAVSAVQRSAIGHGLSCKRMISGAGHDAQILSSMLDCAMIFIPSRDGISHNVTEYSTPEHVTAGANVLLGAVQNLLSS